MQMVRFIVFACVCWGGSFDCECVNAIAMIVNFRVVIITVFHSYLPFTVKPKSVYRFTVTRKTNDQNMNYFFPSQLFTPFSTGNSVV